MLAYFLTRLCMQLFSIFGSDPSLAHTNTIQSESGVDGLQDRLVGGKVWPVSASSMRGIDELREQLYLAATDPYSGSLVNSVQPRAYIATEEVKFGADFSLGSRF